MPDSSAIDSALIATLGSDAALLALCPNGVYYGEAPGGSTRFVIVYLIDEEDTSVLPGTRAIEDAVYLVEARMLSTVTGSNIAGAAARLDALLENATLSAAGYTTMTVHREKRVRDTDVDDQDSTIRWFRRGGHYRVQMSVGT